MKIVAFLFLTMSCVSFAKDSKNPSIKEFKISKVNLQNAILELNRRIADAYPGRNDLLVAYVASPNAIVAKVKAEIKIDLHVANDVPIQNIVHFLTERSICHYRLVGGCIIVYGWQHNEGDKPD